MRVKRYVVDSMPDALHRIRVDLGKDAVILNTKEIKVGGFIGLFAKKKIEVIAATDTTVPIAKQADPPEPSVSEQESARTAVEGIQSPPSPSAIQSAATQQAPSDEALIKEVRQMKEMMLRFSTGQGAGPIWPDSFQRYRDRLMEHDVDPVIVAELLTRIIEEGETNVEWTEELVDQKIRSGLLDLLKDDTPKTIRPDTKIVHFVGPTGVGKTTTIAKLAAEQVLKFNRKVGFITSDTYRIAAVEQLKVYANILNVPLEVVFSPQEMNKAFRSFADKDIIFMDTAGRNYRNELYVSELNAMLRGTGQSETYLVLSLTSKYRDMKVIVDNFTKFKLDKVLFTKMDETETLGSIVNLAHDFNLRGSYVTNGQNVPDDIEVMKEERIVDLIMGGNHDE